MKRREERSEIISCAASRQWVSKRLENVFEEDFGSSSAPLMEWDKVFKFPDNDVLLEGNLMFFAKRVSESMGFYYFVPKDRMQKARGDINIQKY